MIMETHTVLENSECCVVQLAASGGEGSGGAAAAAGVAGGVQLQRGPNPPRHPLPKVQRPHQRPGGSPGYSCVTHLPLS